MEWIEQAINLQRDYLERILSQPLIDLAVICANSWPNRTLLDYELNRYLMNNRPHRCRLLYVVDRDGIQRSSNISELKRDSSIIGRDLSGRPYHQEISETEGQNLVLSFVLSKVYIDKNTHKPCITALSPIIVEEQFRGYVAADFCLNNLPLKEVHVKLPQHSWRQIKGDPSIRSTLFQQTRTVSAMDKKLDEVMDVMESLMTEQGIFHAKFHFSSSRATLWTYNDPYRYRLHVLEEIIDPEVCLVYAKTPYPPKACIEAKLIPQVLKVFKLLRQADETIYLRAASLNVMNGFVGLNFSCDGSHYMHAHEFLEKDIGFWLGYADTNRCDVCEAYEFQP